MSNIKSSVVTGSLSGIPSVDKVKKINIAIPSYGSKYSGAFVRSFYAILTMAPKEGVKFSFSEIDYPDIVTARNYLISNFYYNKTDCTHILFVDDDMGFDHRLIFDMLKLNKDVVGVIAPRRKLDLETLHHLSSEKFAKAYASACDFIGSPKGNPDNGFYQVNKCGTGILLISRDCISKMIAKCPDIVDQKRFKKNPFLKKFPSFLTPFNKIELEDAELSEDISFCYRWTNLCSGQIWANTSHKIQHVGEIVIESCYDDLKLD